MLNKERSRLRDKSDGTRFEDDGWRHVALDRRRLEWNDPNRCYSGGMEISGDRGGALVVNYPSVPPLIWASGRPLTEERTGEPDPVVQG